MTIYTCSACDFTASYDASGYCQSVAHSITMQSQGEFNHEVSATGAVKPCGHPLADGQWWHFCGETDMGQTPPVLCVECGGDLHLKPSATGAGEK